MYLLCVVISEVFKLIYLTSRQNSGVFAHCAPNSLYKVVRNVRITWTGPTCHQLIRCCPLNISYFVKISNTIVKFWMHSIMAFMKTALPEKFENLLFKTKARSRILKINKFFEQHDKIMSRRVLNINSTDKKKSKF